MAFSKTTTLSSINVNTLVQLAVLTSVAVSAPLLQNQLITGSLVNATLFIAASTLGLEGAIFICLIPSLIALGVGTLPLALAPLLPLIMLSNVMLVLVFLSFKKLNYWPKMVIASILKFVFLFGLSSLFINLLFPNGLASKFIIMMSWPQLVTALIGGSLAFIITKKYGQNN